LTKAQGESEVENNWGYEWFELLGEPPSTPVQPGILCFPGGEIMSAFCSDMVKDFEKNLIYEG